MDESRELLSQPRHFAVGINHFTDEVFDGVMGIYYEVAYSGCDLEPPTYFPATVETVLDNPEGTLRLGSEFSEHSKLIVGCDEAGNLYFDFYVNDNYYQGREEVEQRRRTFRGRVDEFLIACGVAVVVQE